MKIPALSFVVLLSLNLGLQALDVPLPAGWQDVKGIRQGPEGSFAVFGPFSASDLNQAVILRTAQLSALGTKMSEKQRETIQTSSGIPCLKVLFEINNGKQSYWSPHYFLMTGKNEYFVIKVVPKTANFSANAKAIEDHLLQKTGQSLPANPAPLPGR